MQMNVDAQTSSSSQTAAAKAPASETKSYPLISGTGDTDWNGYLCERGAVTISKSDAKRYERIVAAVTKSAADAGAGHKTTANAEYCRHADFKPAQDVYVFRHPVTDDVVWATPVGAAPSSGTQPPAGTWYMRHLPASAWANMPWLQHEWKALSATDRKAATPATKLCGMPLGAILKRLIGRQRRPAPSGAAKEKSGNSDAAAKKRSGGAKKVRTPDDEELNSDDDVGAGAESDAADSDSDDDSSSSSSSSSGSDSGSDSDSDSDDGAAAPVAKRARSRSPAVSTRPRKVSAPAPVHTKRSGSKAASKKVAAAAAPLAVPDASDDDDGNDPDVESLTLEQLAETVLPAAPEQRNLFEAVMATARKQLGPKASAGLSEIMPKIVEACNTEFGKHTFQQWWQKFGEEQRVPFNQVSTMMVHCVMETVGACQNRLREVDESYRLREQRCQANVDRLRDQLAQSVNETHKLRDQLAAAETTAAASRGDAGKLRDELATRDARITLLEKEATMLRTTAGAQVKIAADLHDANEQLRKAEEQYALQKEQQDAELGKVRKQLADALKARDDGGATVKELREEVAKLNKALASANTSKTAAEEMRRMNEEQVAVAKKEADDATKAATDLEARAMDAEEALKNKQSDLEKLQADHDKALDELAARDKQIQDMHAQIESQRAASAAAAAAVATAVADDTCRTPKRKATAAVDTADTATATATKKQNGTATTATAVSSSPAKAATKPVAAAKTRPAAATSAGALASHAFAGDCGDE